MADDKNRPRRITAGSLLAFLLLCLLTCGVSVAACLGLSDAYAGVVAAVGGGQKGIYVVRSIEVGIRSTATSGDFIDLRNGEMVSNVRLGGDHSEVGTELPAIYVPQPLRPPFQVAVWRGSILETIVPAIFLVIFLPIAIVG